MTEFQRAALAVVLVLAWVGWCLWLWWCAHRQQRGSVAPTAGEAATLVAYASQSGTAEALAQKRAEQLRERGDSGRVHLLPLNRVSRETLLAAREALFVVSTYGEGEAPDNGAGFARRYLSGAVHPPLDLSHLDYSVVALGDRAYATFCAFGQALYDGLAALGARARTPLLKVDRQMDDRGVRGVSVDSPLPEWLGGTTKQKDSPGRWQLLERCHLNPGSPGAPLYLISLRPEGNAPHWRAGDVFELRPQGAGWVREYSVASSHAEGLLKLIVRQQFREDGSLGLGSGWLTERCGEGERFNGKIRSNAACHTPDHRRPLLLIGTGSGLAGLRAQLAERASVENPGAAWLIYGERCEKSDRPLAAELENWLQRGVLKHCDRVFSRSARGMRGRYVQELLKGRAEDLIAFLKKGADIYVCGSKSGMGQGVHIALQEILGHEEVENLLETERYRRDLY